MSTVEDRLAAALRGRADGDVDGGALLVGAQARAQSRRSHRAMAGAAAASGLVVVLAVSLLGPGGGTGTVKAGDGPLGPPPTAAGPPPWQPVSDRPNKAGPTTMLSSMPKPAVIPGEPGAAQRPDLIGTDASAFHFDVGYEGLVNDGQWWQNDRMEGVNFGTERSNVQLRIAATQAEVSPRLRIRDAAQTPTTVNGRPATLFQIRGTGGILQQQLEWEAAPGVWVNVDTQMMAGTLAESTAELIEIGESLRFDRALRCGTPLAFDALPAGSRITSCVNGPGWGWYEVTGPNGGTTAINLHNHPEMNEPSAEPSAPGSGAPTVTPSDWPTPSEPPYSPSPNGPPVTPEPQPQLTSSARSTNGVWTVGVQVYDPPAGAPTAQEILDSVRWIEDPNRLDLWPRWQ